MSLLAAEGHSQSQIVIQQLQRFLQLQMLVRELYVRSSPTANVETVAKDADQMKQYEQLKLKVKEAVQTSATDFVYYERAISRINYITLFSNLIKLGNDICKNQRHSFYFLRREQVAFIKDVVSLLTIFASNLQKNFHDLNIHCFRLFQDINNTLIMVQKIKFQHSIKTQKFEVHMNFPKYENIFIKNEPTKLANKQNEVGGCQLSHTATTRPSSTGKSSRLGKKTYKNPVTQTPSVSDSYIREHKKQSNPIQTGLATTLKLSKLQRCKTAKGLPTYRKDLEKLKSAQNVQHISGRNSKRYVSFHQIINQKNETQENKNQVIQQKSILNSSTQRWTHNKKENLEKPQKKHRNAFRGEVGNNQNDARVFLQNQAELNRIVSKNQKGSVNINMKQTLPNNNKRNYLSHQNAILLSQKKYVKKFKSHQPNKRKNNYLKNHSKFPEVVEQAADVQAQKQQHKDIILLIKPPEQKLSQLKQKSHMFKNSLESLQQAKLTTQQMVREGHKRRKRGLCSLSNSQDGDCDQGQVTAETAKVDLCQVNAIRSDFIKTRTTMAPFSDNQEGSTFFIEQNFLSHRENFRFQSYLKRLKESCGDQFQKQPFNIDYEAEEVSNKRLIEIERFYTFRSENDWIRERFCNGRYSQEDIQLAQAGFHVLSEQII